MAYESLRGALFRNNDKTKDTDRDYSGELNVDGVEYWVSGWVNVSKKGSKYLSIVLKPKDQPKPSPSTKSMAAEMSDQIPF